MKWKDRVLLITFGTFIIIFLKYFGPTRSTNSNNISNVNTDILKRQLEESLTEIKFGDERAKEGDKIEQAINQHPEWSAMNPWDLWQVMVNHDSLTNVSDHFVEKVLKELATAEISKVDVGHRGTQLKATIYLKGGEGQKAIFKPRRYDRDTIFQGIYEGSDRHNGEVASFHLDRLLGFYRAPPVVGRYLDIEKEVYPVLTEKIKRTFFKKDGNTCFYGVCMYCKKDRAACANGNMMEGSVTIWIPPKWRIGYKRHPYQRTYRKNKRAKWEYQNICKEFTKKPPYNHGRRLLDIMDASLFDFLIGNADRHHYEYFQDPNEDEGLLLHLDNGKSFGNPNHDEMSILAPITQCCKLRSSTYVRLNAFLLDGEKSILSGKLETRLRTDRIYPVLNRPHLDAIDRRLLIVLKSIQHCIDLKGIENVLLKDDF